MTPPPPLTYCGYCGVWMDGKEGLVSGAAHRSLANGRADPALGVDGWLRGRGMVTLAREGRGGVARHTSSGRRG